MSARRMQPSEYLLSQHDAAIRKKQKSLSSLDAACFIVADISATSECSLSPALILVPAQTETVQLLPFQHKLCSFFIGLS
eukprot:108160-Pleurochrysis_carterae.AAC.3